MIITRTPLRLSLNGGGSDYPSWYDQHTGLVVGGAIHQYVHIQVRRLPPYHDFHSRLIYSEIEAVKDNREVRHRGFQACLEHCGVTEGVEILHSADLPARSGTGSSSAFVVGLLNALKAMKGRAALSDELAREAIHVEQEVMGEVVGCQDQWFSAIGGLRAFRFHSNGEVNTFPIPLSGRAMQALEAHLMMFFTGVTRTASEVASTYVPILGKQGKAMWATVRLAELTIEALHKEDWIGLGELLTKGWQIKRSLSPTVSNPELDIIYDTARVHGAVGGKLLGAGGGGMMVFVVPPEKQPAVAEALKHLIRVPVRFEQDGSRIIYYRNEEERWN